MREAPGLKEQVGRTKDAAIGIARAHVELAKTEGGAIVGEVKRVAILAGLAISSLLLLSFLLPIGLTLFLGEWLFGSIGWGVLHGTELLVAVAVAAALIALRVSGVAATLGISLVVGALLTVVFGLNLLNQLYAQLGSALVPGIEPGVRPLVVGLVLGAIVVGVLLALVGARAAGGSGAIGGLIGGAILGLAVGAFSAITFPWHVAIAVGIAIALGVWPALMIGRIAAQGIDVDALKARFWPSTTIETTKETIEWIRERAPLVPKS